MNYKYINVSYMNPQQIKNYDESFLMLLKLEPKTVLLRHIVLWNVY